MNQPPKLWIVNGFHVESDGEAAELYFLNRFAEIEAVFSVSSTVSRRAMTFGLNAYAFWCCFPFAGSAARFFEKLMGDVPPEFEIRDFRGRRSRISPPEQSIPGPGASAMASRRRWIGERLGLVAIIEMDCFDV